MSMQSTQVAIAVMQGGLNLATPPLSLDPGEAIQLHNYEVNNLGRYRRIDGYQRFDGTWRLHALRFFSVAVVDASQFVIGEETTVTEAALTMTGTLVWRDLTRNLLGISYEPDEDPPYIESGAAVTQAGVSDVAQTDVIFNSALDADDVQPIWRATQDYYRALIQPLPGSGPVRGVVTFQGVLYGFRDSADGLSSGMYRADPASGWVQVTTPARQPGGTYKFVVGNFTGSSGTFVLIGVDGVNPAFVYDGTTVTHIASTITPDTPVAAAILPSKILALGFENGSLVTSAIGDPTDFDVANGASEIAVADRIRDLQVQPNKALAIFCSKPLQLLYGTTPLDFELTTFSESLSAKRGTVQNLGDSIFLSDAGVRRLARVDQYGDFQDIDLSIKVKPLLDRYQGRVTSSFVVREKNQYRLCFEDGAGLILTFAGNEVVGASTFNYGRTVRCAYSGADANGREEIYFGSDDGYVYQAERNTSFDGEAISAVCRPAFNFISNAQYAPQYEHRKRFKKAVIEVDAVRQSSLRLLPELDYSGPDAPTGNLIHSEMDTLALGGGGYYDEAAWNEVYWSTAAVWLGEIYLSGVGRNISLVVFSNSDSEASHTINSIMVHYSRRARRR